MVRPRVLLFDVFGTLVDWRTGLLEAAGEVQRRTGTRADWPAVVDDWRRAYQPALDVVRRGARWRDLDALQADTLDAVLGSHHVELAGQERRRLVGAWRRLPPWPDVGAGLDALRRAHVTATLSNGHVALLVDLLRFGGLRVDAVLSAELTGGYKPDAQVYLRAAALLGCPPGQAVLVAAHPDDLAGAAAAGLGTAYVRRPLEWGPGQAPAPDPADLPSGAVVVDDLTELAGVLSQHPGPVSPGQGPRP